jgi:hypothetical protein
VDALYAVAMRLRDRPAEDLPHALVLLGDQVYAHKPPESTLEFIRSRRDKSLPPGEEVADFEEYARLYADSWGDPAIRWLFSTLPSAMIFDDHEVSDDWNISEAWVEEMRNKPWWNDQIVGANASYWVYQHLGNLSPRELEKDELFEKARRARRLAAAARVRLPLPPDLRRYALELLQGLRQDPPGRDGLPRRTERSGAGSRTEPPAISTTSSSAPPSPYSSAPACTTCKPGTRRSAGTPGAAGQGGWGRRSGAPRTSTSGPRSTSPSRRSPP